jgi:ubiquinone/menaquinone biosynthesis C-methylase UbiE
VSPDRRLMPESAPNSDDVAASDPFPVKQNPPAPDGFFDYYARASESAQTVQRFHSVRSVVLRLLAQRKFPAQCLRVADIGCGAGTQALIWASLGHQLYGLDINERLIQLAAERAARAGFKVDFVLGSAAELPWRDESMDLCLVPELLEHVRDWRACVRELARVLRPGGAMFLSTTNKLCPVQMEFDLPLYSWYPRALKKRYERLAVTSRPELVNFAKYPAVNWFSFYSLRSALAPLGFRSYDRFDVMDPSEKGGMVRLIALGIRVLPFMRFLGHMASASTLVFAIKELPSTTARAREAKIAPTVQGAPGKRTE